MNTGVWTHITIIFEIILSIQRNHDVNVIGMVISTVSTSFAKRFTTRPIGVVSKNDIGDFKTLSKRPLWSTLAARRVPKAMAKAPIKTLTARK